MISRYLLYIKMSKFLEYKVTLLGRTVPAILRYYSQVLTNAFNEGVSSLSPFRFLLPAGSLR